MNSISVPYILKTKGFTFIYPIKKLEEKWTT